METNINANINNAECIKSTNKIGETVYQNICNGQLNTVPWGAADWAIIVLFGGMLLTIIIGFIRMIFDY